MRKAILVPSDISKTVKPVDETLDRLDSEMMHTIQDANTPIDVKMIKYNQILQRYKFLQTDRDKPYRIETEENSEKLATMGNILDGIPKKHLPLAKSLTDFISKQQNIHIEDNGELTIDGTRIKNSNIIDIIHDLARDRKTHPAPVGIKHLTKALREANVPLEYIGNKNRWNHFQQESRSPSPIVRQLLANASQYATPTHQANRSPCWTE